MNQKYSSGSQNLPVSKLRWVEQMSYLLDEQFRVPGTNFRFGFDPIMNLIPFLGDISGFIISAALVLTMAKNGASNKLVIRMSLNILLDAVLGSIPLLGQIFDFYYKANTRNIKFLREHYTEGKHQGSARNLLLIIFGSLLLLMTVITFIVWKLSQFIIGLF